MRPARWPQTAPRVPELRRTRANGVWQSGRFRLGQVGRTRPFLWATFGQSGPLVVGYLAFVIIAHLVSPNDFGLFSLSTIWVAFVGVLGDLGLGVALLREKSVSAELAEAAFRLTVWVGVVLTVLAASGATLFGLLVHSERVVPVAAVLSLRLLSDALTYVPTNMSQRRFRFRFLAVRDLTAALSAAVVGVLAASLGAGVWSFVAMVLTQGMVTAAAYNNSLHDRRSRHDADWLGVRKLLPFGLQITCQQYFKFATQSVDSLIAGSMVGITPLGQYRVAQRVALDSSASIRLGIGSFLLPTLANNRDRENANDELVSIMRALAAVVAPLLVYLAMEANLVVNVVLGKQWATAIPLVRILCLASAAQLILLPIGELMKSAGKARWLIAWTIGLTALLVISVGIGSHISGLKGVAWGYVIAHLLALPAGWHIFRRLGGPSLFRLARAHVWIAVSLSTEAASLAILQRLGNAPDIAGLLISGLLGLTVYIGILVMVDRQVLVYIFKAHSGRVDGAHS